jgi:hypothetical protein
MGQEEGKSLALIPRPSALRHEGYKRENSSPIFGRCEWVLVGFNKVNLERRHCHRRPCLVAQDFWTLELHHAYHVGR